MPSDEKRPLGKILLQRKLVSVQELEEALRAQRRSAAPPPLASVLVEEGKLDEIEALRALSEQSGVPGIDLSQIALVLEHLALVPREVAETQRVLPVLVRGDRIFLAMANPHDKHVIDELEFVTGKKIYPYVAVHSTLTRTIGAAYAARDRGDKHYLGPRVPLETLRALGLDPPLPAQRPAPSPPLPLPPAGPGAPPAAVPPPAPSTALPHAPPSPRPIAARGPQPSANPAHAAPPAVPLPAPPEPAGAAASHGVAPHPAARRPPSPPVGHLPASPPKESVVLHEAVEQAGLRAEISTGEFGAVRKEISNVTSLPADLRVRATQAAEGIAPGSGKVILVVDDEEEIRTLLKRLLLQKGYRVLEADRGLLALRLVKDHVPDLIVLDAMLPELHGFDIARRIKASAKYGRIPIVMVSAVYRGWRFAEDLKRNYGVEEYIEKPFRIADVLDAVQRLLARGEQPNQPQTAHDAEHLSAEAEKALQDGIAAYKAGQAEEAIEHLKRGVAIDPLAYRLHFHLALLYGKKGQVYEGIQELERAIDLCPRHFAALKNLAVLYEKAGLQNKAVEMWERCAAAAPDDATRDAVKQHLVKLI